MFNTAPPSHPHLAPGLDPEGALEFPKSPEDFWGDPDVYWQLVRTLRVALPPPPDPNPTPQDWARRDRAAMARVAALAPTNAVEAELAAQFVAASDQWKECLRLARLPETSPDLAAKFRAQALAMMRQASATLRLLLRLQDRRRKVEADGAAADRAAWSEHRALSLMAEALASQANTAASAPLVATVEPPAAPPAPEPICVNPGRRAGEVIRTSPSFVPLSRLRGERMGEGGRDTAPDPTTGRSSSASPEADVQNRMADQAHRAMFSEDDPPSRKTKH